MLAGAMGHRQWPARQGACADRLVLAGRQPGRAVDMPGLLGIHRAAVQSMLELRPPTPTLGIGGIAHHVCPGGSPESAARTMSVDAGLSGSEWQCPSNCTSLRTQTAISSPHSKAKCAPQLTTFSENYSHVATCRRPAAGAQERAI